MGLDAVEILMEVEESFGIRVPDDRAAEMRTVGALYAYVLDQTRDTNRDPTSCLTAATFYALRRQLTLHIGDARSIRPRSRIQANTTSLRRRELWRRLADEMDLRFPPLRRPSWLTLLCTLLIATATFGMFILSAPNVGIAPALLMAGTMLLAAGVVAAAVTAPLAVLPEERYATYGGLVTQLVTLNYQELSQRHHSWNPTDVWLVLQRIIVEQLGVSPEEVTPEADFVYDLGCD